MDKQMSMKITKGVEITYTSIVDQFTEVVYGHVKLTQGRGKKPEVIDFIWNRGCDIYPTLKNIPYNRETVYQIAKIVEHCESLRMYK